MDLRTPVFSDGVVEGDAGRVDGGREKVVMGTGGNPLCGGGGGPA